MTWRGWLVLGLAVTFPTLMAWVYFVAVPAPEEGANPVLQTAYTVGKVVQFALPVPCLWFFERRLPWPAAPTWRGVLPGLGFGLLVVAGMLVLYYGFLRGTPLLADTAGRLRRELREFGLASTGGFALFAAFITVLHSLLEEYYWRWFAFGWPRRHGSLALSLALSSVGFMVYHMVLLAEYFPGQFFLAVLPFGLCTGAGAVVWGWLYERTGSLHAPWLSHLLVDVGLFALGYDMYFVLPG